MADPEKDIFVFTAADGSERKGDPVELLRRLTACCGGDPNALFKQAEDADPLVSLPANERLAKTVCTAFRLGKPWDDATGEGVREHVWQRTLDAFLGFLQGEANGADGSPTSPASSAPESST